MATSTTLHDLIERIWEFWDEHGTARERIGEFIERISLATFLEGIGVEPSPKMVKAPRDNPVHLLRRVLRRRASAGEE